jgi:microcystin-dependent protein
MEGTVGEIRLFAANFAPNNWAYCSGQLIAVRSNTPLYSILGVTYGGDGVNTFGLPNFNGRTAIGAGQGAGLSMYKIGNKLGANTVNLNTTNLPPHTHGATANITIPAYSEAGESSDPGGHILAGKSGMYSHEPGDTPLLTAKITSTVNPTGGSMPLSVTQASLGMNYVICMYGMFPPRP